MVRRSDLTEVEGEAHASYERVSLCEIRRRPPFLATPPRPYMGAWSRDSVQVSYMCMRTLISLGLRVPILFFLGCSRYANDEDPRGHSLVTR
jgi:hypothetical protein